MKRAHSQDYSRRFFDMSSQNARQVSSDSAVNNTALVLTEQYVIRYPVPANVVPVGWDQRVTKVITINVLIL